jgi:hypothetical protein
MTRCLFPSSFQASLPRGPATLSIPPFLSRQLECDGLHPRVTVAGVTIVTARHLLAQRIDRAVMDAYIGALVRAVSDLLAPHLKETDSPSATMALHVDMLPSKSAVRVCVPNICMPNRCTIAQPQLSLRFPGDNSHMINFF